MISLSSVEPKNFRLTGGLVISNHLSDLVLFPLHKLQSDSEGRTQPIGSTHTARHVPMKPGPYRLSQANNYREAAGNTGS